MKIGKMFIKVGHLKILTVTVHSNAGNMGAIGGRRSAVLHFHLNPSKLEVSLTRIYRCMYT